MNLNFSINHPFLVAESDPLNQTFEGAIKGLLFIENILFSYTHFNTVCLRSIAVTQLPLYWVMDDHVCDFTCVYNRKFDFDLHDDFFVSYNFMIYVQHGFGSIVF